MKPHTAIILFVLFGVLILAGPVTGAGAADSPEPAALVLADKGKTDFTIVTSAKPSSTETFAAEELRRYLNTISGAQFRIASKPAKHSILVCRRGAVPSEIALPASVVSLPAEGYCLCARDGALLVVGADDHGMLYAVYDLLQRLGCRWLAPAFAFYQGAHETAPKTERLCLSLHADIVEKPVLKYRKLYVEEGHSHNTSNLLQMIEWMPKRRFNTVVVPLNYAGQGRVMWDNWRKALTPELQRRGLWIEVGGHGYENFLNAQMESGQLFVRHPDWFHMDASGSRIKNLHAVFCTSNREAREYLTGSVIHYLDARPEIQIFDFWPPDGAKWCQCTNCVALGTPSERQALLLAEVSAALHGARPDVKFETIAYAAALAPPLKPPMDPRVLIDFCPIGQCFEVQLNDPTSDKNAAYVTQLNAWRSAFKGDISIYSYYRKYAWRSLPNLIPHYMQNDLRFYRGVGVRGISSYAEPGDWAAYELNHYVLGGLAWNPNAEVDSMIREFASARFGAQAALGLKAYQVLEDNVRHVCSLPGTALKTSAEYDRAAAALRTVADEINTAHRTMTDNAAAAALDRLGLSVDYALRDLLLQKARVEHVIAKERRDQIEALDGFIQQHAKDGVFVSDRIPAAKQAVRYGVPER